jgi:DNA-binding CsgD family transcriptional regulator
MSSLTIREQEILNMLLEGISPKDIAYRLNISYKTVDFHRNKLYRKVGVKSIQELFTKFGHRKQLNFNEYSGNLSIITMNEMEAEHPLISKRINKLVPNAKFPDYKFIKDKRFKIFIVIGILLLAVPLFFFLKPFVLNTPAKTPFVMMASDESLYKHIILSYHAEWYASVNSADQTLESSALAALEIRNETIQGQEKDVLTLTSYIPSADNWMVSNFATANPVILARLRESSGVRFKVLGDRGIGWELHLWTDLEDYYMFPIYTVNNQVIEIDIPFSSLIKGWGNSEKPFDRNTINHLVILRHSGRNSLISGYSEIKIFDFETY